MWWRNWLTRSEIASRMTENSSRRLSCSGCKSWFAPRGLAWTRLYALCLPISWSGWNRVDSGAACFSLLLGPLPLSLCFFTLILPCLQECYVLSLLLPGTCVQGFHCLCLLCLCLLSLFPEIWNMSICHCSNLFSHIKFPKLLCPCWVGQNGLNPWKMCMKWIANCVEFDGPSLIISCQESFVAQFNLRFTTQFCSD